MYEDYNSNQKNSISVHSEDHNQLKKEVLVNTSNLTSGAYSRVQINDAFVSPRDAGNLWNCLITITNYKVLLSAAQMTIH